MLITSDIYFQSTVYMRGMTIKKNMEKLIEIVPRIHILYFSPFLLTYFQV